MDPALTQRIIKLANQNGVPPAFAWSLIRAESGGAHLRNGKVITSPAGAVGLMQLMPATARGLGVDPYDEAQNLEGGMRMLGKAWKTYNGNQDLVAASYNAGGGAVAKYGGVPPYAETKAYIKRIRAYQRDFGGADAGKAPAQPVTAQGVELPDMPMPDLSEAAPQPAPAQPYMDAVAKLGGFSSFKLPEVTVAVPATPSLPQGGTIKVQGVEDQADHDVVKDALQFLGTPYSWGGGSPSGPTRGTGRGASTVGFDCSAYAQWFWAKQGVKIPRTTYEQIKAGRPVSLARMQPGDLVFFGTKSDPHHVGIFIGNGKYVEAPRTGGKIQISKLAERTPLAARTYR